MTAANLIAIAADWQEGDNFVTLMAATCCRDSGFGLFVAAGGVWVQWDEMLHQVVRCLQPRMAYACIHRPRRNPRQAVHRTFMFRYAHGLSPEKGVDWRHRGTSMGSTPVAGGRKAPAAPQGRRAHNAMVERYWTLRRMRPSSLVRRTGESYA